MVVNLAREAKALPIEERKRILAAIPETELHYHLAELFRAMRPDYWVEVTHGSSELGKDLVILRDDPLSPDVMAVVVKRGDIRAKTAGDIDGIKKAVNEILTGKGEKNVAEVLSQIAQAKAHPAEITSKIDRLVVTKVFVALVGEISESVKKRFLTEVAPAGDVFDLEWLVRNFSELYPQVFFDGRATDILDGFIRQLEEDVFYQKTNRTLSDCFVDPLIEPEQQIRIDRTSLVARLRQKRVPFSDFAGMVLNKRRVLLIGDPGSGKSKVAAKLCIDSYRAQLSKAVKADKLEIRAVPLLIPARKLQQIATAEQLLGSLLPTEVQDRIRMSILIVDGLDEVQSSDRLGVLEKASAFADQLDAALLVTSRKVDAAYSASPGFSRFEILPFQIGQAMQLVEKVLTNAAVLPALRDGVEQIRRQLPMNPLSLLLLIQLVAERGEVPASITELFDRFVDAACGRYDKEKGIDVLFEYVIKKRFLAALAYQEFRLKNRLEIPSEDFDRFLTDYASRYRWDDAKLKVFAREVERSGIIRLNSEVFFRHRSFLDYFVALYLFDNRDNFADLTEDIVRLYFDGIWTDVAFFFVGLRREVSSELLDRILNAAPGEHMILTLLAGRFLQAGWASTTDVKEHGIRRVVSFAPKATDAAHKFLEKTDKSGSPLWDALVVAILAEQSLGSMVLSDELKLVLDELRDSNTGSDDELTRQVALLWASRRTMSSAELEARIRDFIKAVHKADLSPIQESKFLFMAALADASNAELQKTVTRRLRTLLKRTPTIFRKLIPGAKVPFRAPKT